jgi:hypothetical protein
MCLLLPQEPQRRERFARANEGAPLEHDPREAVGGVFTGHPSDPRALPASALCSSCTPADAPPPSALQSSAARPSPVAHLHLP